MNPWRQQSENEISLLKDSYDYYRKVDNGAKMITAFEEKKSLFPKTFIPKTWRGDGEACLCVFWLSLSHG